ncbi:MAG: glycosyltransferase [Deltaproteobacteria bacterium]|nr:glycosyltransferase [Deltaproteobacteria bacterium]
MLTRPIKLLIVNHRWWYPTLVNGADVANHEFARRLVTKGVEVKVLGMVAPDVDGTTRRRNYTADGVKVQLVQSDFIKNLSNLIESYKPDIVLTSTQGKNSGAEDVERMVNIILHYSIPVVLYIHDLNPVMNLFENLKDDLAAVITNSHYMADKIQEKWTIIPHVIYPVPSSVTFKGSSHLTSEEGEFITFFNPLPHKGRDIVNELVNTKLKDRSFLFVEGFMEPESHGIALLRTGNVVHAKRSPDVASVYLMTKTLIIPSQWEEPFGRVALEAMYNKIPVIASNTGGLPESVGEGGLLIDDYTNPDAFEEAIIKMDDDDFRQDMIRAGQIHMKRFSMDKQTALFIKIFKKLI